MKISFVLVPTPDWWRERPIGTSTNAGRKVLIRPVTPYRAESWTLNKDIAKWLAAFERKVLRRMFGEINGNKN